MLRLHAGFAFLRLRGQSFERKLSPGKAMISLCVTAILFPPEKIFISYRGISVYHFGTGEAEFISHAGN